MLAKYLGILLSFFSSIAIYLTHPNQTFLPSRLPTYILVLGWSVYILSFFALLYALPKLVAVFLWLAVLIAVWSFAPFPPLFKQYIPDEN